MKKSKGNIHIKKSKKGSLHKALGIPQGEKIPASKLRINAGDSPALRKKKQFAANAKKFKHQAGGTPGLAQITPGATSIADQYNQIGSGFDVSAGFDSIDPNAAAGMQANGPQEQPSNPGAFSNTATGKKIMDRHLQNNAYIKDANLGMTAVTDVANAIEGGKQKRQEYLQLLRSETPKFMTNTNANGLNNSPAYTMFGGDDRNMTSMMFGGDTDGNNDYSGMTNEQYGKLGIGRNDSFWGTHGSIYKNGGQVSSDKAKEILKDGTANGHKLTDKQKRYFGWLAGGGKAQIGGDVASNSPSPQQQSASPAPDPTKYDPNNSQDRYYGANATLAYYKGKLNDELKKKNPQGYTDYFKGLQGVRSKAGSDDTSYIQDAKYDDYLSPDEIKKTLGDKDYQSYIQTLQTVENGNPVDGKKNLAGKTEGDQNQDYTKMNYGRRFASLRVDPDWSTGVAGTDRSYGRKYTYNPQSGSVDLSERGDSTLRPVQYWPGQQPAQHQAGGSTNVTVGGTLGDPQTLAVPNLDQLPRGMKYSPRYTKLRPGANAADSGAYQYGFDMAMGDRNFNYANMMPGLRDSHDPTEQDMYLGMMEGLQPHGLTAQLYLPKDTPAPQKHQAGGYAVGDEVDLTPAQIKQLKKQGYKIQHT